MQSPYRKSYRAARINIVLPVAFMIAGCAGAGQGAVEGAAGGALAGAASGLVSALVWGGDPGEHMARGATAGAAVGAVGGAVHGSQKAKAEKDYKAAQEQQEIEQFRRDIGNDAFDAVVALAECRQEVAIANAKVAANSTNANHALAGLWIQALTFEDQGDQVNLDTIAPEIIQWDRGINDADHFSRELQSGYQDLIDIRAEYALPLSCNN
ncbi:MAG: hypothetical protein ACR2QU_04930 [Gammaproteobacteria bacterium]